MAPIPNQFRKGSLCLGLYHSSNAFRSVFTCFSIIQQLHSPLTKPCSFLLARIYGLLTTTYWLVTASLSISLCTKERVSPVPGNAYLFDSSEHRYYFQSLTTCFVHRPDKNKRTYRQHKFGLKKKVFFDLER